MVFVWIKWSNPSEALRAGAQPPGRTAGGEQQTSELSVICRSPSLPMARVTAWTEPPIARVTAWATPPRPDPVRGKIVSHETGPWCQKGWGRSAGLEFHHLTCCMHTKTLCLFIHSASITESQDACVPLVTLGHTYCTWVFPLGLGAVWLLASDLGLPEWGSHALSVNEPASSTQRGIGRWGSAPGCG